MIRITSGTFKGRKIHRPERRGTRPTTARTREAIMNSLDTLLNRDRSSWTTVSVLDAFAGSGALGIEALSRGAQYASFVERSRAACETILKNLAHLGLPPERAHVINADFSLLPAPAEPFDVIFVDPPYASQLLKQTLSTVFKDPGWLAQAGLVVGEHAAHSPPPAPENCEVVKRTVYGGSQIFIIKKTS